MDSQNKTAYSHVFHVRTNIVQTKHNDYIISYVFYWSLWQCDSKTSPSSSYLRLMYRYFISSNIIFPLYIVKCLNISVRNSCSFNFACRIFYVLLFTPYWETLSVIMAISHQKLGKYVKSNFERMWKEEAAGLVLCRSIVLEGREKDSKYFG